MTEHPEDAMVARIAAAHLPEMQTWLLWAVCVIRAAREVASSDCHRDEGRHYCLDCHEYQPCQMDVLRAALAARPGGEQP